MKKYGIEPGSCPIERCRRTGDQKRLPITIVDMDLDAVEARILAHHKEKLAKEGNKG